MYQVIGLQKILIAIGVLATLVFAAWIFLVPPAGTLQMLGIAYRSALTVAVAVLFIGQTPLFPKLCRLPLINALVPDLDGEWRAELTSNWPEIAKAYDLPQPKTALTNAKIIINVRLLWVRIELISDSKYSESDTVAVRILKNQEHGDVSLHYVYKNETPIAESTDSSAHLGAASLKLKGHSGEEKYLDGHYWTNRNWEKGLNTAGRITMHRAVS